MNYVAVKQEALPQTLEVGTLARELAHAYRSSVNYHKKQLGLPTSEAVAQAEAPCSPEYEQSILYGPPDQVHWSSLEDLACKDTDLALQRWEEIKQAALDELQSGHRAARVMEGYNSEAWQRAQFLAIRDDLAKEWQPRTGIERQLIDAMAQAQTAIFFWQERLMLRASIEPMHEKRDIEEHGGWNPPRVSEHQAVEQAGTMVDRFNRIFLRTLRALCNLRKVSSAVVVQNAGQVNFGGGQQVNVAPG